MAKTSSPFDRGEREGGGEKVRMFREFYQVRPHLSSQRIGPEVEKYRSHYAQTHPRKRGEKKIEKKKNREFCTTFAAVH